MLAPYRASCKHQSSKIKWRLSKPRAGIAQHPLDSETGMADRVCWLDCTEGLIDRLGRYNDLGSSDCEYLTTGLVVGSSMRCCIVADGSDRESSYRWYCCIVVVQRAYIVTAEECRRRSRAARRVSRRWEGS